MSKVYQANKLAQLILNGFNRHHAIFTEYNRKAAKHFHDGNWSGAKEDASLQVDLYDQRVLECVHMLKNELDIERLDTLLWQKVKREYVELLYDHLQPELAESYYNSVFCRLFNHRYYNNRYIFFNHAINTQNIQCSIPDYRCYYPVHKGLESEIRRILEEVPIDLPYYNIEQDVRNICRELAGIFFDSVLHDNLQIHILTPVFYRNKSSYLVGRIINSAKITPFIICILQNGGQLYVDAALTDVQQVSHVFSFTRAYFKADFPVPSVLVHFLQSILPHKTLADLYNAIGFHKQGKNEFYRSFIYHLRHSTDQFMVAPGEEGMVMLVFTLPSYPYVFKIIKDRFHPNKKVTLKQIKERYHLIKQHDRVGRMADTWEFSYAAFPLSRFNVHLLDKLETTCHDKFFIEGDKMIIRHLYIERRMIPLNLYLQDLNPQQTDAILQDYAKAIEEIAAAGIFPGDLLPKNFGVTRTNRVVFYDYDEIVPLEQCNFRRLPTPRTYEQEMATEPWYHIDENDIFPEEFKSFLMNTPEQKGIFGNRYAHLLTAEYWQDLRQQIMNGMILDVFPYHENMRFYPHAPNAKD